MLHELRCQHPRCSKLVAKVNLPNGGYLEIKGKCGHVNIYTIGDIRPKAIVRVVVAAR